MTKFTKMTEQFPDFDQATLPPIPANWADASWHKDVCPAFTVGDVGGDFLHVFIDHADPSQREFKGHCRFTLILPDSDPRPALNTDDWKMVLYVAGAWENDRTDAALIAELSRDHTLEDFQAFCSAVLESGEEGDHIAPDGSVFVVVSDRALAVWIVTGDNGGDGEILSVESADTAAEMLHEAFEYRRDLGAPVPSLGDLARRRAAFGSRTDVGMVGKH